MKRSWIWALGTGRWSALLGLAMALVLLAAVACGGEEDDAAEPAAAPDTVASTTDATTGSDAMTATTDAAPEPSTPVGHEVGMLAPDFTVETIAGETFTLSEVTGAGSPVLLYFFTTW